uniref:Uncharacterized protein n=2 Tax=Sipha flava TaxID=143950 RepID=A0A2S2R4B6_9HEMI
MNILSHNNSRNKLVRCEVSISKIEKIRYMLELWPKNLHYIKGTKIQLIFCYITRFSRVRQFYMLYRGFRYMLELWPKNLHYIKGTKIQLIFCYITRFSRDRQFYTLYRDFRCIKLRYTASRLYMYI